jgi:hypothetical protein
MGYELNGTPTFVIKQSITNILFEYAATFNYRSQWAYKTRSNCFGYSIRRGNWHTLLQMNESISIQLTAQIERRYEVLHNRL